MKFLKTLTRHRHIVLLGGTLLALFLSLSSDPDHGASTALGGLNILQGFWAILAAHLARKALMDYAEADWQKLFQKAGESPVGAGLALIASAIVLFAVVLVFSPRAHASEVPAGFKTYGPVLKAEQVRLWPNHPDPAVLAALVEQESCVSLKSRMCWNPSAKLKSSREEGAGMGQITRAYSTNGSLRFDSLTALRRQYSDELVELSWVNVYTRPDLQLRAIVLMSRDSARPFRDTGAMLAFGDAAYNGGQSGVQQERRACVLAGNCNADIWFDNVEKHCLKSRQPLYGGKNACDINREHVKNVLLVRRAKYAEMMS